MAVLFLFVSSVDFHNSVIPDRGLEMASMEYHHYSAFQHLTHVVILWCYF